MKRILSLTALFGLLMSCTPAVIPPATSVTGHWQGSISKYGMSASLSSRLTLTDAPNTGDFTGTGQIRGIVNVDNAVITGNVKSGNLSATNGTDTVSCTGIFRNNNEYNGTCSYQAQSAPLYMSRQGD